MNLTRNFKSVALAIAGVILLPGCASNRKNRNQESHGRADRAVKASTRQGLLVFDPHQPRHQDGQRPAPLRHAATAAHKTLPMGTKVRVTNQWNGKSEIVTINDRGPFHPRPHHRPDHRQRRAPRFPPPRRGSGEGRGARTRETRLLRPRFIFPASVARYRRGPCRR
jgi:rare lipoprotein A